MDRILFSNVCSSKHGGNLMTGFRIYLNITFKHGASKTMTLQYTTREKCEEMLEGLMTGDIKTIHNKMTSTVFYTDSIASFEYMIVEEE